MSQEEISLGQRVALVNHHGIQGTVVGIYIDRVGTQFNVEYADREGHINSRYFVAQDLRPA